MSKQQVQLSPETLLQLRSATIQYLETHGLQAAQEVVDAICQASKVPTATVIINNLPAKIDESELQAQTLATQLLGYLELAFPDLKDRLVNEAADLLPAWQGTLNRKTAAAYLAGKIFLPKGHNLFNVLHETAHHLNLQSQRGQI